MENSKTNPIRAVVFDCFGVLYGGSLEYLYSITEPSHHRALRDISHAADAGFISRAEFFTGVSELCGIEQAQLDTIVAARHVRIEASISLVKEVQLKGLKTGLLSNAGVGAIDQLFSPIEQQELFTAVCVSGEVGMVKPYPEIFSYMAKRLQLQPYEILMIDDMLHNVAGAQDAGMQAIHFTGASDCRRELQRLAIL
ncbi:HAD family phosphatase [Candidatus Saccharibacteria bacterium]|nr:HAD family phosphatase [Candidatus Saccharibacteria bacterium]